MEPTTKTLHFRYHPRFTTGMVLRHQTIITSGLPFRIEQKGWLVRSISFQGWPGFPRMDSYTALLEQESPTTEESKS